MYNLSPFRPRFSKKKKIKNPKFTDSFKDSKFFKTKHKTLARCLRASTYYNFFRESAATVTCFVPHAGREELLPLQHY